MIVVREIEMVVVLGVSGCQRIGRVAIEERARKVEPVDTVVVAGIGDLEIFADLGGYCMQLSNSVIPPAKRFSALSVYVLLGHMPAFRLCLGP